MRLFSYRQLSSGVSDKKEWVFNLQEVIPTGHKRTVRSVAWSPNGQVLATASFDSTVGLWERIPENIRAEEGSDGPEWECFGTLEGHDSECKSVAFSYNGNLLASCGRDKSVWVWEAQPDADYECIGVLIEHSQDVKCVLWHPKEEVRMASDSKYSLFITYVNRFWHRHHMTIPSKCTSMIHLATGIATPHCKHTLLQYGL